MSQLYESHNDVFSLLPAKFYRHDLSGKYIYSPLHWHRSIELTITITGNIRFNTGSSNLDFDESDWILINSCELHSCRYINSSDHFSGISLVISLPFIEKWLGKNLFFYNPGNVHVTEKMHLLAKDLFEMDTASPTFSFQLMSKLYEALALISQYCIKTDTTYSMPNNQKLSVISEFTEYIEQHFQEDLSLDMVAEHFEYSAGYFSRLFKETLGVNYHSYLNFVRISHAAGQLSEGYTNLTACAYENGFPNVKSFINTFKKLYGCTPSVFIASLKD